MPRPFLLVLSLLTISTNLFSQQEAQATLFTTNYTSFNPAMAGVQFSKEANVLWRNQWTAINGAPAVLWVNYNQRLNKIHGAVGFNYSYDVIGFQKMHSAVLNYAYHIQMKKMLLSFGASAGMKYLENVSTYYIPPTTLSDPSIPTTHFKPAFNAQAGIAVHTKNLNAGFSVTQLNGPGFRGTYGIGYKLSPVYHLHADYTVNFTEKWKVTPAIHVFFDLIKYTSTSSIKVTYADKLWFGVNSWNLIGEAKSFKTFGPMVGYNFKERYRVGYSLEFNPKLSIPNKTNLTHEIVLSFLIK